MNSFPKVSSEARFLSMLKKVESAQGCVTIFGVSCSMAKIGFLWTRWRRHHKIQASVALPDMKPNI